MPPTLTDLTDWLGATLGEARPLFRPGPPEVRRLALALEPGDLPPEVPADALFLHRARRVGDGWPGLGVLNAHDGFDLHLTTGPNRRLARALSWTDVRDIVREGKLSGITATPPQRTWREVRAALLTELGGEDDSWPPAPDSPLPLRLALMNAMNPGLIRQVADEGARLYMTGQMRPSAAGAAREVGMGVIALGHRRTELWGLRQLARELRATFPDLELRVYSGDQPGEAADPTPG